MLRANRDKGQPPTPTKIRISIGLQALRTILQPGPGTGYATEAHRKQPREALEGDAVRSDVASIAPHSRPEDPLPSGCSLGSQLQEESIVDPGIHITLPDARSRQCLRAKLDGIGTIGSTQTAQPGREQLVMIRVAVDRP